MTPRHPQSKRKQVPVQLMANSTLFDVKRIAAAKGNKAFLYEAPDGGKMWLPAWAIQKQKPKATRALAMNGVEVPIFYIRDGFLTKVDYKLDWKLPNGKKRISDVSYQHQREEEKDTLEAIDGLQRAYDERVVEELLQYSDHLNNRALI